MATHSTPPVQKIPWMEEPGGLQSMGSLGVRHDSATSLSLFTFMHWKRKWQPLQYSCLENPRDGGAWWAAVHGVARSQTWLNDFTFTFHFCALEKGMTTHSKILAWKIPWTGEPGGLLSMGLHRVRHDWSDLAAAAAAAAFVCGRSQHDIVKQFSTNLKKKKKKILREKHSLKAGPSY